MFRFAASSVLLRGGGALQTDIIALCGEHSPCSGHTGFAPYRGVCAFPSTLLRLPAALYGAGPALRAVPVFGSSTKAWTRLRLRFVPSPLEQLRQPGACQAHSPRAAAFSPPRPQPWFPPVPARCVRLVFSCDPPGGCQPSRISGSLWLETGGLLQFADGRGAVSRRVCPFPLPPASCLLPPRGWAGPQPASSSLALLSPFVLQTAGSVFRPVNFLSLSPLLSHSLSCYLMKAPSDCPQGTQARSLP